MNIPANSWSTVRQMTGPGPWVAVVNLVYDKEGYIERAPEPNSFREIYRIYIGRLVLEFVSSTLTSNFCAELLKKLERYGG